MCVCVCVCVCVSVFVSNSEKLGSSVHGITQAKILEWIAQAGML